jgi:hypothetical protein
MAKVDFTVITTFHVCNSAGEDIPVDLEGMTPEERGALFLKLAKEGGELYVSVESATSGVVVAREPVDFYPTELKFEGPELEAVTADAFLADGGPWAAVQIVCGDKPPLPDVVVES